MTRIRTLLMLVSLGGATSLVQAGVAGWTAEGRVAQLQATDIGRFIVRLRVDKNVSGCRDADRFYADYGRPGSDLMYRTLLEALINEREVQVYVSGACDLNGYSELTAVRINP